MRNEGTARCFSPTNSHASDLRPRGRAGSSSRTHKDRAPHFQRDARASSLPLGSSRSCRKLSLSGRGRSSGSWIRGTYASPTVRCFPVQPDQCSLRRSFPHTAAGQRRNWLIHRAVQASLLTSSFHRDERMKTTSERKSTPRCWLRQEVVGVAF
jgi:hypothetical protein